MSESQRTKKSPGRHRVQLLIAELSRMVALRRELAMLEIARDRSLLLRGVISGGIGFVAAVTGLPLLLQAVALWLANITTLSEGTWAAILGTLCLVPGILLIAWAVRKVRSGFCGLRGTLAELNEDLIWLREWADSEDDESAVTDDGDRAEV